MNTPPERDFFQELKRIYFSSRTAAVGILQLACLEMQLAVKSFGMMLCFCAFLFLIIASIWFLGNALGLLYLTGLGLSIVVSLLILIGFNALIALLCLLLMLRYRKDMSFAATRKQISLNIQR